MNRYPRYVLVIFAAVTLLLLGLVLYITLIFDPNDYKPQIIQLVKDKKQRELRLDGDIKLTFFPSLRMELSNLSLGEHESAQEFASVEQVRVSLALMPLLRRELAVREIGITGLRANLIRYENGRTNIDDLIARSEVPERVKFVIDHVRVDRSVLTIRDEASESRFTFRDFDLKADKAETGASAMDDAVRSKVELGFKVNRPDQSGRIEVDAVTRAQFAITFDPDKRFYAVDGLRLTSEGQVNGIRNLAANLTGDFSLDFATSPAGSEFTARGLALDATGLVDSASGTGGTGGIGGTGDIGGISGMGGIGGVSSENRLDIKIGAPRLNMTGEAITGDQMTLMAKVTRPADSTSATVSFLDVQGTLNDFTGRAATLEAEYKKEGSIVRAMLVSPLAGSFIARQLNLPAIAVSIDMMNGLPDHAIRGSLTGSMSLDGLAKTGQVNLTGNIGDSNVNVNMAASGFAQPDVDFEADIDQLDLDRLLPATKDTKVQADSAVKAAGANKTGALPGFSLLNDLGDMNIRGIIRIGSLKASNVRSSGVRLEIKPDGTESRPGRK